MESALIRALVWIEARISGDRGEIGASAAIGGLILLVAYLAFPGPFIGFFHWIMHHVFSALHSSFGDGPHHAASKAHEGAAAGHARHAIGPGKGAR